MAGKYVNNIITFITDYFGEERTRRSLPGMTLEFRYFDKSALKTDFLLMCLFLLHIFSSNTAKYWPQYNYISISNLQINIGNSYSERILSILVFED